MSFESTLYILIQVIDQTYALKWFPTGLACGFLLLLLLFLYPSYVQRFFLILMNSDWTICYFMICVFGVVRNLRLTQGHKSFPPFSYRCFIVLGITFRPMVHFKLIFLYVAKYGSKFCLFVCFVFKLEDI